MSELDTCPNGGAECDFAEQHELALAGKILRMIESYTHENQTFPCPKCLRNSMMAIAALLHLEASKIEEKLTEERATHHTGFVDTFADAARERMLSVMDAVVDFDALLGKRRLM